ncbi:MAG: adenine nucleotide alpha hydrolase [Proteobacteria bacterium]|nr:adenine nucleotide alpha hydrolase [Pseudomonadota bacterium]
MFDATLSSRSQAAGDRLRCILAKLDTAAVAVSGGVDSLTLATIAHRTLGLRVIMHHATSPAVPAEATERVRRLARTQGWALDIFDAGEFADERYRANPVNRCFFCKTNLYGAIATRTRAVILSGTNLDDLGDYRPGLEAARQHGARHPFVEAKVDKTMVRVLAADLALGDIAELPSAPCLSSRVETGIAIEAPVLAMIEAAEILLRERLSPRTVRCRLRRAGIVVELDADTLTAMTPETETALALELAALAAVRGVGGRPVAFAPYRTGSAFLKGAA